MKGVKGRDKGQPRGTTERMLTPVLALPQISCVILGKFLHLTEPVSMRAMQAGWPWVIRVPSQHRHSTALILRIAARELVNKWVGRRKADRKKSTEYRLFPNLTYSDN